MKVPDYRLIDVAVAIPDQRLLTYKIPDELIGTAGPGSIVFVPIRNRMEVGIAIDYAKEDKKDIVYKPIVAVLEDDLILSNGYLKFIMAAASFYSVEPGGLVRTLLPSLLRNWIKRKLSLTEKKGLKEYDCKLYNLLKSGPKRLSFLTKKKISYHRLRRAIKEGYVEWTAKDPFDIRKRGREEWIELVDVGAAREVFSAGKLGKNQEKVLERIITEGPIPKRILLKEFGDSVNRLLKRYPNLFTLSFRDIESDFEGVGTYREIELNEEQRETIDTVKKSKKGSSFLLWGLTGSGKTEIYLRLIKHAVEKGKGAIYVLPEIGLTPQVITKLRSFLKGIEVGLYHSELSEVDRLNCFRRVIKGELKVVVGARSSVFLPMKEIGLIIIDEEHDDSHKNENPPFYNAREIALMRARHEEIKVILGSGTPSLEMYYNAIEGKLNRITLKERPALKSNPKVKIVDLKEHSSDSWTDFNPLLTDPLVYNIKKTIQRGMQVMLLLNRRAFSKVMVCHSCGNPVECQDCGVSMSFHLATNTLRCHFCGRTVHLEISCPFCGGKDFHLYGEGTQKIEQDLADIFPENRIARMDSDAISSRKNLIDILDRFDKGRIDILVGTKMITKGHDFPNVGCIGVLDADQGLDLPDFRASERLFQTLIQIKGRLMRSKDKATMILQTTRPENWVIRTAVAEDYEGFYRRELASRKNFGYPPFMKLGVVWFEHPKMEIAKSEAQYIKDLLISEKQDDLNILGGCPAPFNRIRGNYRYLVLLKSRKYSPILRVFSRLKRFRFNCRILLEINPQSLL